MENPRSAQEKKGGQTGKQSGSSSGSGSQRKTSGEKEERKQHAGSSRQSEGSRGR